MANDESLSVTAGSTTPRTARRPLALQRPNGRALGAFTKTQAPGGTYGRSAARSSGFDGRPGRSETDRAGPLHPPGPTTTPPVRTAKRPGHPEPTVIRRCGHEIRLPSFSCLADAGFRGQHFQAVVRTGPWRKGKETFAKNQREDRLIAACPKTVPAPPKGPRLRAMG